MDRATRRALRRNTYALMAERVRREAQVSVTEEWAPDGTVKRTTKMDNSMPGEAELLLKMLSLAPPEAAEVVNDAKAKGILPEGNPAPAPTEEVVAEQGPAMQEDDQADVKGRVSEGKKDFRASGKRSFYPDVLMHKVFNVDAPVTASKRTADDSGVFAEGDLIRVTRGGYAGLTGKVLGYSRNDAYSVQLDGGQPGDGKGGQCEFYSSEMEKTASKRTAELRIKTTYEVVTPESAEAGDFEETGWHDEVGKTFSSVEEAASFLRNEGATEYSDSRPDFNQGYRGWYIGQPDNDYETGAETTKNYHLEGFSSDDARELHKLVTGQDTPPIDHGQQEMFAAKRVAVTREDFVNAATEQYLKSGVSYDEARQYAEDDADYIEGPAPEFTRYVHGPFDKASSKRTASFQVGDRVRITQYEHAGKEGELGSTNDYTNKVLVILDDGTRVRVWPGDLEKVGSRRTASFQVGDKVQTKDGRSPIFNVVEESRERGDGFTVYDRLVVVEANGQRYEMSEKDLVKVAYSRYSGDPFWMKVKYPTTCKRCGKSVQPGEEVFRFKDGSMYCDAPDCGQRESNSFNASAQDEAMFGGGMDEGMMEFGSKRVAADWESLLRKQRDAEGYVAAIKDTRGGETYWGKSGETHKELIFRVFMEQSDDKKDVRNLIIALDMYGIGSGPFSHIEAGFVDPEEGRFLSQDEMQNRMGGGGKGRIITEYLPSYQTAAKRTAQSTREYLETFFEEKQLPHQSWDITDQNGTMHYIDSDVVIEALLNAPPQEQEQAANIIRKIDFMNGDVNHFLKHLATGLVMNSSGGSEIFAMRRSLKTAGYSVRKGTKAEIEAIYPSLQMVSASGEANFSKPSFASIEDEISIGDNGSVTVFKGPDRSGVTGKWWELEGVPVEVYDRTASKRQADFKGGERVKINSDFAEFPYGFVESVNDDGTVKVVYDNEGTWGHGIGPARTFYLNELEKTSSKRKADDSRVPQVGDTVGKVTKVATKKEEGAVQAPVEVHSIDDTKIQTWFERDRQHVALVDAETEQNTIIEWWDEAVTEAVEDGFLDPRDYHGSAYDYAKSNGLLIEMPYEQPTWDEAFSL